MNTRLLVLRLHLPASVRRSILTELIAATARAFDRPGPRTTGLSVEELSARAVDVSRAWADEAIRGGGDLEQIERRLFSEAFDLGLRARDRLRLVTETDGLAAARIVYRAIGIDVRLGGTGDVLVARCAFARAYGPEVCRLMSSMDSGLIAGLTGAAGLRFTERITEGAPACRALVLRAGGAS
jgi:hypothetical protein